jgi:glycosyltransferase involved in cell wall biosynthesis
MKIGVNGRFLTLPYTGIGQYTQHLLNAMAKQAPEIEWVVVVPQKLSSRQVKLADSIRVMVQPHRPWPTLSVRNRWWEQHQVPRLFEKEQVDMAFYPYPANPSNPSKKISKTVVTVHDIIPWVNPHYRKKWRTRWAQNRAQAALKHADDIICVSQTTAFALSDLTQFPYDHLHVVHEAAGPEYTPNRPKGKKGKTPKRPYLIYVGGYDQRKNVKRLVEAYFEYIAPRYSVDLVLVGANAASNRHYTELENLQSLIEARKMKDPSRPLKGQVRTTAHLSPHALAEKYRHAIGFVNVSKEEGFNLPLLEAAQCGTPIITSDIPIHREVLGESALFADPKSTKAIGTMLVDLIQDDSLRQKLVAETGRLREKYDWKKAATETLKILVK